MNKLIDYYSVETTKKKIQVNDSIKYADENVNGKMITFCNVFLLIIS